MDGGGVVGDGGFDLKGKPALGELNLFRLSIHLRVSGQLFKNE